MTTLADGPTTSASNAGTWCYGTPAFRSNTRCDAQWTVSYNLQIFMAQGIRQIINTAQKIIQIIVHTHIHDVMNIAILQTRKQHCRLTFGVKPRSEEHTSELQSRE